MNKKIFLVHNNIKKYIGEFDMDNKNEIEVGEDGTKYGEFVSSYFAWISLPKQKENAKRLEEITKKDNKNQGKNKKSKK